MNLKADLATSLFEISQLYFQTNSFLLGKDATFMHSVFGHINSLGFIYLEYMKQISSKRKKHNFLFVFGKAKDTFLEIKTIPDLK